MSSAVNLGDTPSASEGGPLSTRPNPVSLEVSVNATGTRPGSDASKRELFSEDTTTVLVFVDGAVIHLSAAVAPGQLIFLTNKETNREVVCQVQGKRTFRPTSCYVELLFTEEQANFWGVMFPASTRFLPKVEAAEVFDSSEPTDDVAGAPTPPPSEVEVSILRSEVEALREQLKLLSEKPRREEEDYAPPPGTVDSASAATPSPAPPEVPTVASLTNPPVSVRSAQDYPPIEPQPSTLGNGDRGEPSGRERKSHVAMALPTQSAVAEDPTTQLITDELLRPALDFGKGPRDPMDENDPYSIYAPKRKRMNRLLFVGLALILVTAVASAAYQLKLWPNFVTWKLPGAKATLNRQAAITAAKLITSTTPGPPRDNSVSNTADAIGATTPADDLAQPSTETGNSSAAAPTPETKPAETLVVQPEPVAKGQSGKRNGERKAPGPGLKSARVQADVSSSEPQEDTSLTMPEPTGGLLVPAKLVKAVPPVYPPDAMRGFITGDVRLNAVVDATGKVTSAEVLLGPAPLREAAIAAIKQYEYIPATQGGKPVESKVTATIKFWFNP